MDDAKRVTIVVNGKEIMVETGKTLSALLGVDSPCGGHGRCGKCKVIAKGDLSPITQSERERLTDEEIDRGVRLACKTELFGYAEITLLGSGEKSVLTSGASVDAVNPTFSRYGIAVDIGTTTLASRLYDASGRELASAGVINPQREKGADVITRIEWALKGEADKLKTLILEAIDGLIVSLCEKAGVEAREIDGLVLTGNTVMLSLLTGESVLPFSRAPFKATELFGCFINATELGLKVLNSNVRAYLPPCISAFVGADAVCAMLAVDFDKKDNAVIADVGTNGEIAIINGGKITACSTAVGPAFEGVGISCGMSGEEGAVDKVFVLDGAITTHVIGGGKAKGICGSGIVDAIATLLDQEQIDETGYMEEDVELCEGVTVTQKDVRAIQLAKSAVSAGIKTLVKQSGATPSVLYIAGGFGSFLNVKSAGRIGLIPSALTNLVEVVGNGALTGASKLLLDESARLRAEAMAKNATTLELATNKTFIDEYTFGMTFEEEEL